MGGSREGAGRELPWRGGHSRREWLGNCSILGKRATPTPTQPPFPLSNRNRIWRIDRLCSDFVCSDSPPHHDTSFDSWNSLHQWLTFRQHLTGWRNSTHASAYFDPKPSTSLICSKLQLWYDFPGLHSLLLPCELNSDVRGEDAELHDAWCYLLIPLIAFMHALVDIYK